MVEVVLNPELLTGRIRAHVGGQHEDVEEFGAGSGTEGVQTLPQLALKFISAHHPALTLGSSREYRMSAIRLAMMTAAENSRNRPWSSGKSFESIACTVSRPSPG